MAWKSSRREIGQFLEHVGADRDEKGRFFLSWPQGSRGLARTPRSFASRVMIDDEVLYRLQGRWVRLGPAVRRNRPGTRRLWPDPEPGSGSDENDSNVA